MQVALKQRNLSKLAQVAARMSGNEVAVKVVEGEEDLQVRKYFTSLRSGLIRMGEEGWVMPEDYKHHINKVRSLTPRTDDVWIVTYPKSGTTVTQELVWLILNHLDFETSARLPLFERSRFLEHSSLYHKDVVSETAREFPQHKEAIESIIKPRYELAEEQPTTTPRVIKTHLPFSLLPPSLENRCKVIYVARNPKDVCVSFYHHHKSSKAFGYTGTFSQFVDFFIKDLIVSGPYWAHVQEGWRWRNRPNVHFFFYEDLIKDMDKTIRKVAEFLGHRLSDLQVESLVNHLQIDNFRRNVKIRDENEFKAFMFRNSDPKNFIRKGQVGNNKEMTEELGEKMDKWIEANQSECHIPFPVKS